MKRYLALALFTSIAAAFPLTAAAQPLSTPASIPRKDVTFTMGWLNGNKADVAGHDLNEWYNDGLYGGALFGWHWTDHLKTEVEAGVSNEVELYTYRNVVVDNIPTYSTSELTFRNRRLAIGQQYQFYRNAWFHPHLTAGADLIWEQSTEHVNAITTFDQQTRQTRTLRPAVDHGPDTTLHVRPFAEAGFKAYMTPKAFFRSDLRLTLHSGVEQVLIRFGFGVDF